MIACLIVAAAPRRRAAGWWSRPGGCPIAGKHTGPLLPPLCGLGIRTVPMTNSAITRPPEPRPAPQLHPRGLYGLRNLTPQRLPLHRPRETSGTAELSKLSVRISMHGSENQLKLPRACRPYGDSKIRMKKAQSSGVMGIQFARVTRRSEPHPSATEPRSTTLIATRPCHGPPAPLSRDTVWSTGPVVRFRRP